MNNDWFHDYFINELKAIGRKPTSNMQHEVVDSLPSSGNDQTIYFVKNDSSSSNNHYDEYVWISSSSTFEKIGSSQIDGSAANPDWNQNDSTQPDYIRNRPFYTGDPVETVFVEESTVAFSEDSGFYMAEVASTFEATVGDTYKVYWDGTAYERTCISFNNIPAIGNFSIAGAGSDTGEPFFMLVSNGEGITIGTADTSASHTISISGMAAPVVKIDAKYLPIPSGEGSPLKPTGKSYLTFSSLSSFTLNANKYWDGSLEYFASDGTWTTWDGATALSAVYDDGEYVLYLRGTGNTVITRRMRWVLTGSDVACIGNIENLLDYATVESGNHPPMADSCYSHMFERCISLTKAPDLPATTLANECYSYMFQNCTNLTQAPALPATTLSYHCYSYMFQNCISLTQAPDLPATTLADRCYDYMFESCISLTKAPDLPATTLADGCYNCMFQNCTNLTQVPALPATTLAVRCYSYMFQNCTNLTQAPELHATTLAAYCYEEMFQNCTSLKLSSTKTDEYIQEYRIPSSGDGTSPSNALSDMFVSTGGTFTGTPSINTTYYLSSDNMIVRENEIATLNGYVGSMINTALNAIGGVTTLHINVTAVNMETMEPTFTADKTPSEMQQASVNGPIWCVISFAAGIMGEEAVSVGVPPAWDGGQPTFGKLTNFGHNEGGDNTFSYVVRMGGSDRRWILDLTQLGS